MKKQREIDMILIKQEQHAENWIHRRYNSYNLRHTRQTHNTRCEIIAYSSRQKTTIQLNMINLVLLCRPSNTQSSIHEANWYYAYDLELLFATAALEEYN